MFQVLFLFVLSFCFCQRAGFRKPKELKPGDPLLNQISRHFNEETAVQNLAAELLFGKFVGGGYGFIQQKRAAFGQPSWNLMALDILNYWSTNSPEGAFGDKLLQVLEKVLPVAKADFEDRLVGTD